MAVTSPFSTSRFQWIFVGAILVIAAAHVKTLLWIGISWQLSLIDAVISNGLLTICLLAILNALRFYVPTTNRILYLVLWCLILAAAWLAAIWGILNLVLNEDAYFKFVQ